MKSIKILALFVAFFIVQPIFAQEPLYRISTVSGKLVSVQKCQKGEYVYVGQRHVCLKKMPNTVKGNEVQIFTYNEHLFKEPNEKSEKVEEVKFGESMRVITEKSGWYFLVSPDLVKKGWIKKSDVLSVDGKNGLNQYFPDSNGDGKYFKIFGRKCVSMYEEQNPYTVSSGNWCVPKLLNKKLTTDVNLLYGKVSPQGAYVYTFPNTETAEIKDALDGGDLIFVSMAIESNGWYWVSWIDDDVENHSGWVTENDISFEN